VERQRNPRKRSRKNNPEPAERATANDRAAAARSAGFDYAGLDPGACAPGFMLPPAPRALDYPGLDPWGLRPNFMLTSAPRTPEPRFFSRIGIILLCAAASHRSLGHEPAPPRRVGACFLRRSAPGMQTFSTIVLVGCELRTTVASGRWRAVGL